jgi:hypothetical protein
MADGPISNKPSGPRAEPTPAPPQQDTDLRSAFAPQVGVYTEPPPAERTPMTGTAFKEKWRDGREFTNSGTRIRVTVEQRGAKAA